MRHPTKGLWIAYDTDIISASGHSICRMQAPYRTTSRTHQYSKLKTRQLEANTALVAGAPMLLEAIMDATTIAKAGLVASPEHIEHWTKLVQRILDIKPESR